MWGGQYRWVVNVDRDQRRLAPVIEALRTTGRSGSCVLRSVIASGVFRRKKFMRTFAGVCDAPIARVFTLLRHALVSM